MIKISAIILDSTKDGLFDAANPDALAAQGALWNHDIKKLGPWCQINHHHLVENSGGRIWKPQRGGGEQAVIVCGKCTSSMDVAWHFIEENRLPVWDSILAVEQTLGRGQHQRAWLSPPGNIHAAWRWPYPSGQDAMESKWQGFFSLMAGYLMAKVLQEEFNLIVEIKWPNDLLLKNKKFIGILTEARSGNLVIGIGINVNYSPEDILLRNDFVVSATNLRHEGVEVLPLSLWMKIVEKGRRYFNQLTSSISPDEFINSLTPYIAWIGRKVLVKTIQQQPFEAIIKGISSQGGLILQVNGKDIVIYAGSIISRE